MPVHPTYPEVAPGPDTRTILTPEGTVLEAPQDWLLLRPGDAAVTRAVKAAGPTWTVVEKKGRKTFTRGVWAPAANIEAAIASVAATRADPGYQRKLDAGRRRRAEEQVRYVESFEAEVLRFLHFHPRHAEIGARLAAAVTAHATPVGSGTVARTERIPVEERAEAAVIAWMRHQTTGYDTMAIHRGGGERREVRRMLARQSRHLLHAYRNDEPANPDCPLARALDRVDTPPPRRVAPPAPTSVAAAPAPYRPGLTPRPAPRPPGGPTTAATPNAAAPGAPTSTPARAEVSPRNAHEAAQAALYEKVRARFKR